MTINADSIPKQYASHSVEKKWYEYWEKSQYFHLTERQGNKEPYTIVIPPPNVTGALHLGHALNNTIQDILIRWQRMQGKDALWIPGTDHAGIATQAVVEKRLFEEEKKTRHDIGRDELVKRIWAWKDTYAARILNQLRMIGVSCDWNRTRFTLDETCAKAVRQTFFSLFKDGLIYRGKRLVNWDTHLQTAVADDEITHETVDGFLWYFKYPIKNSSEHIIIATTRPETMLGDTAVAVHPDDVRYQHLIGKFVLLPLVNREIPIIADSELVDPKFGTGCVKVTPAHDPNDYATALRHNLPMINILTTKGYINENGGSLEGQDRYTARANVVEQMKALGLVEKIEPYQLQVGHSDRSKTPVEPYLSDQWFVKMNDLAQNAIEQIVQKKINFHPERYAKSCIDWLSEKRDWCISRQLWWGHRIPIWYCHTCTEEDLKKAFKDHSDVVWIKSNDSNTWLICALHDLSPNVLGSQHQLVQDPDVLDTWFSSALWPHSTLGWPENTLDLKTYYPTSVLVTSRDIISLWVARMIITGLKNMGDIPFQDVYIHPKILDGEGRTMSKSLGNGVDPLDIIEKYGVDALRYTMALLCTENQDVRLPVKQEKLADQRIINTSDRFELGRNFSNKIWNASRFLMLSLIEKNYGMEEISLSSVSTDDKAILGLLNQLIFKVTQALEQFRFNETANLLYDFFWHHFCDRYIESVKTILWGDDKNSIIRVQSVLFNILHVFLRLLHPIMPFITEELWHLLHQVVNRDGGSIMISAWPNAQEEWIDEKAIMLVECKFELVRAMRNIRAEYNIIPGKKLVYTVGLNDMKYKDIIQSDISSIKKLAQADEVIVQTGSKELSLPSEQCPIGTVYMHIEGLLDVGKEEQRLEKRITNLTQDYEAISKKLGNNNFISRAPADIIESEKAKLQDVNDRLEKLRKVKAYLVASSE